MIKQKAWIKADPSEVWRWVAHPDKMKEWNPKIMSWKPMGGGEPRLGYQYEMTYFMKGREMSGHAEIIEFQEPTRLVIRMLGTNSKGESMEAMESYTLTSLSGGTELVQKIDVIRPPIPLWIRLMAKFLMTVGTPKGTPYLEQLKIRIEQQTA